MVMKFHGLELGFQALGQDSAAAILLQIYHQAGCFQPTQLFCPFSLVLQVSLTVVIADVMVLAMLFVALALPLLIVVILEYCLVLLLREPLDSVLLQMLHHLVGLRLRA